MKWHSIFAAFCLPLVAFGAKKPSVDRFADFSSKSSPLKLDDDQFTKLSRAPRDYSTAVLLTALEPRINCQVCREFQPEWDTLAKSWRKGDKAGKSRLLFGTLDFMDGKETFQAMQLQHAPVLLLFFPTTGPNARPDSAPIQYDFSSGVQSAEAIHAWISRQLPEGPKPPVVRPFNWIKFITITTSVLGLITFISVASPYILPLVQNRNIWAGVSLIAVLLFTSGHMYNHIRKVPYVAGDGRGGISYFAGGFQSQFGLETQIIAGIYGILAFATINLAIKVPRIANPKAQQVAVLGWSAVVLMVYSFLLSIFRFKNGGYPFWLPPF